MKGEVSISNWYLGDPKQSQVRVDLVGAPAPEPPAARVHAWRAIVCVYRFKRFPSSSPSPTPLLAILLPFPTHREGVISRLPVSQPLDVYHLVRGSAEYQIMYASMCLKKVIWSNFRYGRKGRGK